MNILEISPNQLFEKFIENQSLKAQIEITNKLSNLKDNDTLLINDIIALFEKYKKN